MNFIGIDPGLQGGIAVFKGITARTRIMPIIKGKKTILDHLTLSQFLSDFDHLKSYAILEEQHPMPVFRIEKGKTKKQGATSLFSIGYGFGALKQCLVDFVIPHEVVRAQIWQKEFGISGRKGNTKAQALQICQSLFPDLNLLATERSKKPHEGIVDAVLIAEFARRRYGGTAKE